MARLNDAPPRFTAEEWKDAQATRYSAAESSRITAEHIIADSDRIIDFANKKIQQTQKEVGRKFDERINDLDYWKTEVDSKLSGIKDEIDALLTYKGRLERAIEAYSDPHGRIVQQCLQNRERRKGIDLVHDNVQKELIKEQEVIDGVLAMLERTLEQTNEQIRLNRAAKYRLEKDLENKYAALQIDSHSAGLSNNVVTGVPIQADTDETTDRYGRNMTSWQAFSNDNIQRAERERQNSVHVRSLIESMLGQAFTDLNNQKQATDEALNNRVAETRQHKEILEGQLADVTNQIRNQESNIEKLKEALLDKEAPLKLALVRLENRAQRPALELVKDSVHYRLQREVDEIKEHIDALREQLEKSETSLRGLTREQIMLEEDVDIKSNTLHIDDVQNVGMRSGISIQKY